MTQPRTPDKTRDAAKFVREFLRDGVSVKVVVRDDEIEITPLREEPRGFDEVEWK